MPFTLVDYNQDRASAVTTLSELTPVADDHVTIKGDSVYIPPDLNKIIGYSFSHTTGSGLGNFTGGRIDSPSLRAMFPLDISVGANALDGMHAHTENLAASYTQNATTREQVINPLSPVMFQDSPIPLKTNEGMKALMTNGAVGGARGIAGIWLANGAITKVTGDIRTIKATTTFTPTANEWSSSIIDFVQDLPVGDYQVVGARCVGGDTQGLFRLIFVGGFWRPGGVINQRITSPDVKVFRRGNLGVWGTFHSLQPPKLEVMEVASVANPELYLDLIKVA